MGELPKSIASSDLTIMGVTLKVHNLDNGQRIFESEGIEQLFEAMAAGAPITADEARLLAVVLRK